MRQSLHACKFHYTFSKQYTVKQNKLKLKKRIAIIGGGPCSLFIFKRLIENSNSQLHIEIFEKHNRLGAGMPYSKYGAGEEHVTNVSGNEIPELTASLKEWIQNLPRQKLDRFNIDKKNFNGYKVVPRAV